MSINDFEYVEPASRMQLAEKLSHMSSYSTFLILLLGEEGSGRSTLLDQLEELHEPRTQRLARIDLSEKADVSRLLLALVDAMQLDSSALTDNRLRLAAVHKQVRALAEVSISLHLQIDNADLLTDNSLELLLSLFQLGNAAPRLLLTASPEFEQRVSDKGILDRFENKVHIQRLAPFEEDEVEDFALSLLPAHVELSPKQLKKLVELSNGYPGSIIASVEALLRQGGGKSAVKSFPIPPMHLAAVAGILIVITGFAVWHYLPSSAPEVETSTRIQVIPEPVAADTQQVPADIEVREILAQRLAEQEARLEDEPLEFPPIEIATPATEVEPVPESDPAPETLPEPEPETVAELEAEPDMAPETVSESAPESAEQQPAPEAEPVVVQAPAASTTPTPVAAPAPTQSQQPSQRSEPPTTSVTETAQPVARSTVAATGNNAEQLLSWPDNGFTLQMLGARSEESVVRFINSQAQPQRFYRFVTLHQDAPWHVVVYGQYPTRAAATEAVRSLPAELRDRNPWARTISSVKEDIRKIDQ